MPVPPPIIPSTIKPLHLYRQILREVSYLPPAFSGAIRTIISHRFHLDKANKNINPRERLSRGRHTLRRLRDANNGHAPSMHALLIRAFARAGASRKKQLRVLSAKDPPSDSEALAKAIAELDHTQIASSSKTSSRLAWLDKLDKRKLAQYAASQNLQDKLAGSSWLQGYHGVKAANEDIRAPKLNIWGKPTANNIVRAKEARIWRILLAKTLPPVPRWQWELLRDLASGAQETAKLKVPARRPMAKTSSGSAEESDWDWKPYALQPTGTIETRKRLRHSRISDLRDQRNPFTLRKKEAQAKSDRYFRRAYEAIWRNTSIMEQDPSTLEYTITWGGHNAELLAPTQRQLEFLGSAEKAPPLPVKKKWKH